MAIKLPLFVRDSHSAEYLLARLKSVLCPHCKQCGWLIGNGKLKGNAISKAGRIVRGQRLLCSNRHARGGCGRSCCFYFSKMLPGFTVSTAYLLGFLKSVLLQRSVHGGWLATVRRFSPSSAYRWWHRFEQAQTTLRQRLCRKCKPPGCQDPRPIFQLIQHLHAAFSEQSIEAYQLFFQYRFW